MKGQLYQRDDNENINKEGRIMGSPLHNDKDGRSVQQEQSTLRWFDPPRFRQVKKFVDLRTITDSEAVLNMCPACQEAKIKKVLSCRQRLRPWILSNHSYDALLEGQRALLKDYPKECGVCDPRVCHAYADFPVGFDQAAPTAKWGATPTLQSLPDHFRIPARTIARNTTTEYFANWTVGDMILYTYNPSIIPAPESIRKELPDALYLASFRVSPLHTCGPETYPFHRHRDVSYLGIAVMDKRLRILRDVVVDINGHFGAKNYVDFRLFLLEGRIYLGEGRRMLSLSFSTIPTADAIPNLFGSGLHLTNHSSVLRIANVPPIKNNQYFHDLDGKLYTEVWPVETREVLPVTITDDGTNFTAAKKSILPPSLSSDLPLPSFVSSQAYLGKTPFIFPRGRGSACCIKIPKSMYKDLVPSSHTALQHDYLLMGIDHGKSIKIFDKFYVYLSRLYAFPPETPFGIVARSGFFCLSSVKERSQDPHVLFLPHTYDKVNNQLNIRKHPHDCPRVHFVSGMTEDLANTSQVIVAYGINDCVPRLVVLEKQSMVDRLFLPFTGRDALPP